MADRRQDLFTLFRNAANLARTESYRFVGGLLAAALSGGQAGGGGAAAPTAAGGGGGAAWQDVEVAVSLLYQLGETAPEADMKPGSGVLAQLAAGVMQVCWGWRGCGVMASLGRNLLWARKRQCARGSPGGGCQAPLHRLRFPLPCSPCCPPLA